jgi:hypothetical protein
MVDLSQTLRATPEPFVQDRLSPDDFDRLRSTLEEHAAPRHNDPDLHANLARLRYAYEPYVHGLSALLLMQVPPWIPDEGQLDDWEVSPWEY